MYDYSDLLNYCCLSCFECECKDRVFFLFKTYILCSRYLLSNMVLLRMILRTNSYPGNAYINVVLTAKEKYIGAFPYSSKNNIKDEYSLYS